MTFKETSQELFLPFLVLSLLCFFQSLLFLVFGLHSRGIKHVYVLTFVIVKKERRGGLSC